MSNVKSILQQRAPSYFPLPDLSGVVWERGPEPQDKPLADLGVTEEVWSTAAPLHGGRAHYLCDNDGRFWRTYDNDPLAYRVYPYFFA